MNLHIPSTDRINILGVRIALTVFFVMYPVGMVFMITDSLPNSYLWTVSVFLAAQFAVTFLYLLALTKWSRAVLVTTMIMVVSIIVEFLGVTTGFPFGPYYYSYFLSPFVVGNVPLAISFAWYALVVNTFLVLRYLSAVPQRPAVLIGNTALAVVSIDIMLEPFASYVNGYWKWTDGSVPVQNYAAWFGLALLFAIILTFLLRWKDETSRNPKLAVVPSVVLSLNLLQFSVLNLMNGYWIETILGGVLLGGLVMQITKRPAYAV